MSRKKRTLTTGDIAAYCDVNLRTVLRWIENGHLKAYRLPGRGDNRVEIGDFIAFLNVHDMPIPEELLVETAGRILVVDDDPVSTKAIQRPLEKAGYTVSTADNGFLAGQLLETFCPQLMTVDLKMPGLNGYQVIEHVKATPGHTDLFIVVISSVDPPEQDQCVRAGAHSYLEKPVATEALIQMVHSLMKPAPLLVGGDR